MPNELNPNAQAWVAALRSGKYNQGRNELLTYKNGVPMFCPLGVACDVYRIETGDGIWQQLASDRDAERWPNRRTFIDGAGERRVGFLPDAVTAWMGLDNNSGGNCFRSIPALNDQEGLSFEEIASFIESQPKGLFRTE